MKMLQEFLLFGVIEILVLLLFYKYMGKIDNVKYWHGLILCPLFFSIGLIQFPYAKQIGMIIIMIAYLYVINKKINIKIVVLGFLYLLVVEMIFCMIYNLLGFVDLFLLENNIYYKFMCLVPTRFIEILFIFLYKRRKI